MSDAPTTPEHLRALCEQLGLRRAFELYPDAVKAAANRGLQPLGPPPGGYNPIASPASVFDPTRFEPKR